jgi:hypothetical protein
MALFFFFFWKEVAFFLCSNYSAHRSFWNITCHHFPVISQKVLATCCRVLSLLVVVVGGAVYLPHQCCNPATNQWNNP